MVFSSIPCALWLFEMQPSKAVLAIQPGTLTAGTSAVIVVDKISNGNTFCS